MLELQATIRKAKENIISQAVSELAGGVVRASVIEEPATDYLGSDARDSAIELQGGIIHKIRLLTYDYGTTSIIFRFQYELAAGEGLLADKAANARIKPVKDNRVLGLFGGEIVDVRWTGQEVARRLNSDAALSRQLVDYLKHRTDTSIQIYARPPGYIEILGPRLTASFTANSGGEFAGQFLQDAVKTFRFDIYRQIARDITMTPATV